MKRTGTIILLAIFALAALCYGVPRWQVASERARRSAAEAAALANSKPLVLDAVTQGILSGADRVETFRLADFHEGENHSAGDAAILSGPHVQSLDNYTILHVGHPQGKAFAAALSAAVGQLSSPIGKDGLMSAVPSCFDPGVGFRIWKGQAHTDICICFYCSGVEVRTQDAHHHTVHHSLTTLGGARSAFLALSKHAFPQDTALAALN